MGGAGWVAGGGEGGMTRSSKSINETNTIHVQTSSSSVQAIDVQSGARSIDHATPFPDVQ